MYLVPIGSPLMVEDIPQPPPIAPFPEETDVESIQGAQQQGNN